MYLTLQDAIEVVLSLARDNIAPDDLEFAELRARQIAACDTLEDFAVNHLGDD